MFRLLQGSLAAGVLILVFSSAMVHAAPNVVVILADDMGFSDAGCYGGEIETPHLDSLAENGLRFTQCYSTARCWPTRAALLTGYYAQQVRRDALPDVAGGTSGARPDWAPLLSSVLKNAGYRCYHSGKWHLDGKALPNGFDQSYMGEGGRFFRPQRHFLNDKRLSAVGPDEDFYATTETATYAVDFLKAHQQQHAESPFFLYLAFIAPHFPLQAPQADIDKYRDRYLEGWDKLRAERFERLQELGIVDTTLSDLEPEIGPPYHFPDGLERLGPGEIYKPLPWDQLTDQQKEFQATKMAIHAAMIDRMDQEIGRVLDQIREMDRWEDTLIVFLSDNGASAEIMVRDDGHDPSAPPGSAESYLCLGPGFSSAANTPFRRHKTWVHEGGIASPCIVHWPAGIKSQGELRHEPVHVIDVFPTVLSLAGIESPTVWQGVDVPAKPGIDMTPLFVKDHSISHENLWWLHEGNRALRRGDWKIVAAKGDPWELYDLRTDRAEMNNLASDNPDLTKELAAEWEAETSAIRELVNSIEQ